VDGSNGRRATIRQVAELAGVSTATVSNFLNGRFSAMRGETLARIRTAVEELGYVPSNAAKALRTNRSHVLGVVIPPISGPFFAQFARGAEDEALEHGYMGRPAAAGAARNECASRNECAARGRGRRARAFDSRRPLRAAPGGAGVDRAARWWSHTGRGIGEPRVLLSRRSLYERGRNSHA
jgi:AcrR family transcriptional regulator